MAGEARRALGIMFIVRRIVAGVTGGRGRFGRGMIGMALAALDIFFMGPA